MTPLSNLPRASDGLRITYDFDRDGWSVQQPRSVMRDTGPNTAEQITTSVTYKLPPWFTFSFTANQTFARLPEGHFTARIHTATVNYSVSPYLSFSNLVQYDNRSRNLGLQSRVRWTLQPGRDLFLVYGQGWIQDPNGGTSFRPQDSKISTKFQYTFRF